MRKKDLPKTYKGYSTEALLKIWEEIKSPSGTKAPKEMIAAMDDLLREYRLGIFQETGSQEKGGDK